MCVIIYTHIHTHTTPITERMTPLEYDTKWIEREVWEKHTNVK